MDSKEQQTAMASNRKRAREANDLEGSRSYHYDLGVDNGAGTCSMAASFYELLQESGLQHQLAEGYGHGYADRSATSSSSPPPASESFGPSTSRRKSISRPSSKSSSSSSISDRRKGHRRDLHGSRSFRAIVGILPTSYPQEGEEADVKDEEDAKEIQMNNLRSRESSHVSDSHSQTQERANSPGYPQRGGDARREYLAGRTAELNNLRMHILQRANGTHPTP